MTTKLRVFRTGALTLGALLFAVLGARELAGLRLASAESPARYPYDPVCAWGRLGDGHGMLIRCLQPREASQLLSLSLKVETPKVAMAEPVNKSESQQLVVSGVGPAVADTGELPLAPSKLGLAKDRYIDCVKQHGGLSAPKGTVVVRFLVRERGRAEGVHVKSVKGMSEQAGKCIADVVDRRYVGYPAAPTVGATMPIELSIRN